MGRSERLFDNASEFEPERWLEGPSEKQSNNKPPVDDILKPFSLGPRNCIGKMFD